MGICKQRIATLSERRAARALRLKTPTEVANLDYMAETQGFEPWIQVLARMLP